MAQKGLANFILEHRTSIGCSNGIVRIRKGYRTLFCEERNGVEIHEYMADRLPLFYREARDIANDLKDGLFLTPIKDTLRRLPTSKGHQKTHFGEVLASIFAEETLGYRLLYSKLSLLTAENTNVHKMDILLVDMNAYPLVFYLLEAKCSTKIPQKDRRRVYHKHGIYKDMIGSLSQYGGGDRGFDLASIRDRLDGFSDVDRERIRKALQPYPRPITRTLGVAAIDVRSEHPDDTDYILTEPCPQQFDVDILCLENLGNSIEVTFERLKMLMD